MLTLNVREDLERLVDEGIEESLILEVQGLARFDTREPSRLRILQRYLRVRQLGGRPDCIRDRRRQEDREAA